MIKLSALLLILLIFFEANIQLASCSTKRKAKDQEKEKVAKAGIRKAVDVCNAVLETSKYSLISDIFADLVKKALEDPTEENIEAIGKKQLYQDMMNLVFGRMTDHLTQRKSKSKDGVTEAKAHQLITDLSKSVRAVEVQPTKSATGTEDVESGGSQDLQQNSSVEVSA